MSLSGDQNWDPIPPPQPCLCFSSQGAFNVKHVFDVVVSTEKISSQKAAVLQVLS